MKYKQTQMILGPTYIEDLFAQNVDFETIANAMLLNWEAFGNLVHEDESWRLLQELPNEFYFDNMLDEYDSYKGIAFRTLIIKVKDRFFAYHYSSSPYEDELEGCEEVKPYAKIEYNVDYKPLNSDIPSKVVLTSNQYTELFGEENNVR